MGTLVIVTADITRLAVDAIVNAANQSLLGGCPTGEACVTPGFGLPAKWVIHTVWPCVAGWDTG